MAAASNLVTSGCCSLVAAMATATQRGERLVAAFSTEGEKKPLPLSRLYELGVRFWKFDDVENIESDPVFLRIIEERGYNHMESILLSKDETPDLDTKLEGFFKEHMHSQEEIRVILDGKGFWDVRDFDNQWIRFTVQKGDMVVLPAGMLHRFGLDENKYIKALLLYTDVPARTQYELGDQEAEAARNAYVSTYLKK